MDLLTCLGDGLSATVGCAIGIAYSALRPRRTPEPEEKEETPDPPSVRFLWDYGFVKGKKVYGYKCPMCTTLHHGGRHSGLHGPICECFEFPRLHFHWKCPTCAFAIVMRTADDK